MDKKLKSRKEVNPQLTWDLTAIFPNETAYLEAVKQAERLACEIESQYKGKLNRAETIIACLDEVKEVYRLLDITMTYASLSLAVDQSDMEHVARAKKMNNVMTKIASQLSFVESEILDLDDSILKTAMGMSAEYKHYLSNLLDFKPYRLHPEAERVIKALQTTLNAAYDTYEHTKLVDIHFKDFTVDGKTYPLSFGLFEDEWEYEPDHKIRRAAFKAFSDKLSEYQHTMASLYQTHVQMEKSLADLRGFNSVFDSLLFSQKVARELYERQIDLIMEKLAPHMRRYAKHLQELHGIEEMTFADLKIDVDPSFEPLISVEESKAYIEGALGVLGDDYLQIVRRAYEERWIDFEQNIGKATGAFCSTPYGIHPYILISWTSRMREVFVLAHELGHAGHFSLAQQNQNIFNISPSLYFIEAPSTMNEMLMANYLIKNSTDLRFKRWVLSSIISRTYYHNFVTHLLEAAYQREVYKIIDAGGSVQAPILNEIKRSVLKKFWGDTVTINEGAELTWMRQPHYYMGLYPYTYSAGLTIATEVSRRILSGDDSAIEAWREVLKAGGTKTPVELAQMVGVDITTEQPLLNTIEYIGQMIDEIISISDALKTNHQK